MTKQRAGKTNREAGNAARIVWALCGACVLLLGVDIFVHKHGPFAVVHWFGFYGLYSLAACAGILLVTAGLRRALTRREDYYDD